MDASLEKAQNSLLSPSSRSTRHHLDVDDHHVHQGEKSKVSFIEKRSHRWTSCPRRCWANYNYLNYYWLIDGPRYAVMIVGQSTRSDVMRMEIDAFLLDQFYFPFKYHSCSAGEDQRRIGETNPRRVSPTSVRVRRECPRGVWLDVRIWSRSDLLHSDGVSSCIHFVLHR